MAGPVTEEERVTLLIKIIIILTGALLETWPVLVLAAEICICTCAAVETEEECEQCRGWRIVFS